MNRRDPQLLVTLFLILAFAAVAAYQPRATEIGESAFRRAALAADRAVESQSSIQLVNFNDESESGGTGQMPCDDWQRPEFALFCTGRQHGYIEPCGCTGLENAKGGLSRRQSFLNHLRQRNWDVVPIDVGNQIRRFGAQAEIKLNTTAQLLREMDYQAIGLGVDDLRVSLGEILAAIAGDGGGEGVVFTSANVNILDVNPPHRIVNVAGKKLGIVSILGNEHHPTITSPEIQLRDTDEALTEAVTKLATEDCDFTILLAHTSTEDTRRLAQAFPNFDVILTAGGAGEPTLEPETVKGSKAQIVQVGTKGMYVGVLGYYPGANPPFRYQRVELDARFPDAANVMESFALYQKQLEAAGLEGLGLRPTKHPNGDRHFMGHEVCGECHTEAYDVFVNSPHFDATESIVNPTERSNIPRHFDPECLSCHVTGWNAQEYYPYVSGYHDLESSQLLTTNGCENCHGPGSNHVAAENGDIDVTDEQLETLRLEMRLTVEEAKKSKCYECHDLDNSPDFDFDDYWPEVEHHGVD